MLAAYLEVGNLDDNKWVTKMAVRRSNWAGPAHFHLEGVLVGETTLLSLQATCLDDLNHDTYRIIDAQNRVFTMDARLMQVECSTTNTSVRLLLFINSSSPQQHAKLWNPLLCYKKTCMLHPHEAHITHSRIPEAM